MDRSEVILVADQPDRHLTESVSNTSSADTVTRTMRDAGILIKESESTLLQHLQYYTGIQFAWLS